MTSFEPSALGTKNHWQEAYEREKKNFEEIGDVGEIWFGEDVHIRVVNHILENDLIPIPDNRKGEFNVLDLGCGNGLFVIDVAKELISQEIPQNVRLVGIDYAEASIELANNIAKKEGLLDLKEPKVQFTQWDITETPFADVKFHLIHDKGTFDAVCLHSEKVKHDSYKKNVYESIAKEEGSYFVITSCNFTTEELIEHYKQYFDVSDILEYPTFEYGGQKGSTVSTVIFKPKLK